MRIALTGDVMLGRLVDEYVIRNPALPPQTIWGEVLPLLLAADGRFINLECVIGTDGRPWRPESKAFHFRADPRAIEALQTARIDCVTLANNHSLDFGADVLLECFALLDQAGIRHAGAGRYLHEALAPAFVDLPKGRLAVIALTDNEPEWEATNERPGVHFVSYGERGLDEPYRTRLAEAIWYARREASFVLVSAHVGPNWGSPSRSMRALAHDLLNLGADLYWGHSNHTPQGIELHHGKAILYSTGDFIDDYAVDLHERNDLSFLFVLEMDMPRVRSIRLHPVAIEHCRVRLAKDTEAGFLEQRIRSQCAAFGTPLSFHDRLGLVTMG